jgi:hypothetical protein
VESSIEEIIGAVNASQEDVKLSFFEDDRKVYFHHEEVEK